MCRPLPVDRSIGHSKASLTPESPRQEDGLVIVLRSIDRLRQQETPQQSKSTGYARGGRRPPQREQL